MNLSRRKPQNVVNGSSPRSLRCPLAHRPCLERERIPFCYRGQTGNEQSPHPLHLGRQSLPPRVPSRPCTNSTLHLPASSSLNPDIHTIRFAVISLILGPPQVNRDELGTWMTEETWQFEPRKRDLASVQLRLAPSLRMSRHLATRSDGSVHSSITEPSLTTESIARTRPPRRRRPSQTWAFLPSSRALSLHTYSVYFSLSLSPLAASQIRPINYQKPPPM
ncbi:hypothetical protein LZ30DRAFT_742199, partial [Colletotrichum cereale]